MNETDYQALRRILAPVVKLDEEHEWPHGMVTTLFDDGVRLSFLCGPTERLDAIVIQKKGARISSGPNPARRRGNMKITRAEYIKVLLRLIEKSLRLDHDNARHYLRVAKPDRASERVASALWVEEHHESEDTAILRHQLRHLEREGCFDFEETWERKTKEGSGRS